MGERFPLGVSRTVRSPPSLASFGPIPGSNDLNNASLDRLNVQATSSESDSTGSNNQLLSNGSSTIINRSAGHIKQSQSDATSTGHIKHGQSDATSRNGSKTKDSETEWVEQDEPGVYITLTSLPGGVIDLKRVRFRYRMLYCICIFLVNILNTSPPNLVMLSRGMLGMQFLIHFCHHILYF